MKRICGAETGFDSKPDDFTLYFKNGCNGWDLYTDSNAATPYICGKNYTWSVSGNTLNLNGFQFFTCAATALEIPDDSNITLTGVNTFVSHYNGSGKASYGIKADQNLCVCGTGLLRVFSGDSTYCYGDSVGIYACADLTIDSGLICATGGSAQAAFTHSTGLWVKGDFHMNGGEVHATGGETDGYYSEGVWADGDFHMKGGIIYAFGGTARVARETSVENYGIWLQCGDFNMLGGAVYARAQDKAFVCKTDISGDYKYKQGKYEDALSREWHTGRPNWSNQHIAIIAC